jgi:hypothetical protein
MFSSCSGHVHETHVCQRWSSAHSWHSFGGGGLAPRCAISSSSSPHLLASP